MEPTVASSQQPARLPHSHQPQELNATKDPRSGEVLPQAWPLDEPQLQPAHGHSLESEEKARLCPDSTATGEAATGNWHGIQTCHEQDI